MSKFPSPFSATTGSYNLSSVSDSKHVIYFGSAPTQRIVAIKVFLESFKINLQKEKEVISFSNQHTKKIKEKEGSLNYDISLNMPAYNIDEARNNLAKIEELQKLIQSGRDWSTETISKQQPNGTFKDITTNAGFAPLCKTRLPLFWVYFRNLINGGRKITTSKILSFEQIIMHGFPCYIEKVNYEPDLELGFFESDDYLFPKNIKLSLVLNYENQSMFNGDSNLFNNKAIDSYDISGFKDKYDTGLWPFHISKSVNETNDIKSETKRYIKGNSYMFISKERDPNIEVETLSLSVTAGGSVQAAKTESKPQTKLTDKACPKYVIFDLFLDSFSRDVSYEYAKSPAGAASVYSKVVGDSNVFKGLYYNLKINCVSYNINQAKKNLGKLQLLTRMFYKTRWNGLNPLKVPEGSKKSEYLQKLFVYIPNMIEMPNTGAKKQFLKDMGDSSIPLFLEELSYDMDLDQGFFEEEKYLYAKAFSITFKFFYPDNDLILNYSVKNEGNYVTSDDQYYFKQGQNPTVVRSSEDALLFPMDKQTVKIGKPPRPKQGR